MAVTGAARQARPYADEVDVGLGQLAAYLVDGAVGAGRKQHARALLEELFLQLVEQAVGRLARAGRADDEEQLPRLLGAGYERVEGAVASLYLYRRVDGRGAPQQDQVAAALVGREKGVHAAVERRVGGVVHVVLDGPQHSFAEGARLPRGRRLAQGQLKAVVCHVCHGGPYHGPGARVGRAVFGVRVEDDDVAAAEVGRGGARRSAEPQP